MGYKRYVSVTEIHAIVRHLNSAGAPTQSVLATLVTVEGSSYRRPGARLLLSDDGTRIGSVSGGCLEEDILERARTVAATGAPQLALYDTTSENDLVWGVGLGCHGVVQVLIERLPPRPAWAGAIAQNLKEGQPTHLSVVWRTVGGAALGTYLSDEKKVALVDGAAGPSGVYRETVVPPPLLVIFGAGDDAQPLVRLAKEIGWSVIVADPRAAFATAERFPGADGLVCAPPERLVDSADLRGNAIAVVMTHRYVHDVPILRTLLARPLSYLGLLGPKKRAEKILEDLASGGFEVTPAMRSRLHAPVGLDIGGDAPDEVALSIVAEIQAVLAGRDGRPLRERERSIHGWKRFGCMNTLPAGPSSRMGEPKQLVLVDGRPLVVRAVEAALASPVCGPSSSFSGPARNKSGHRSPGFPSSLSKMARGPKAWPPRSGPE